MSISPSHPSLAEADPQSVPFARARGESAHKVLLVSHIAASVSVLGVALVLVALGIAGLRGISPETVYPAAHLVASWLEGPLVILALVTGVAQAVLNRWGLLRYWWVTIKLTITAAATVVVFTVLRPGLASAAAAATGQSDEPLIRAQQVSVTVGPTVAVALLLVNVALGVFKPRWRLRHASASSSSEV